MTIKACSQKLS